MEDPKSRKPEWSDSRRTAVSEANQLGISEHELIELDQRVANECRPFRVRNEQT